MNGKARASEAFARYVLDNPGAELLERTCGLAIELEVHEVLEVDASAHARRMGRARQRRGGIRRQRHVGVGLRRAPVIREVGLAALDDDDRGDVTLLGHVHNVAQ